jgi:hypothetical protein
MILNPFNENVIVAAELKVEVRDQLIELSADKTVKVRKIFI